MESKKYAVVIEDVAALKGEPSETAGIVDELLFGMYAEIMSSAENGWYYINTFYNYKGYINEEHIILLDEKQHSEWKEKAVFYITQAAVDVLSEPKYTSGRVIITLARGAFVSDTGERDGYWSKVELPDGTFGWVRTNTVKKIVKLPLSEENIIRENLVNTAKEYIGTQYRWGGKSSRGIDCSGFCSMVYMENGFIIYRDAELKEEYMKSIAFKDIKNGDLIFFPGHVAMYIGKGKYIHSNGKYGGVSINSFNEKDEDYRDDLANSILGIGSIF